MKMVKSLFLGSAAGLIAAAGAQAADLPVKAAPVEYVKICSLYGAGYYYVPGTDICIKIGGFVRAQYYSGNNNASGPLWAGATRNQNTRLWRSGDDFILRGRAVITMDTRSPTEWGTVRTYLLFGFTTQTPNSIVNSLGNSTGLYSRRAFIQWAGFTFGRAQSFFDLFPRGSFAYLSQPTHDTRPQGTLLAAYTAQWGNGISTTFSLEEQRKHAVVNVDAGLGGGSTVARIGGVQIANINNDAVQQRYPDVVANFRIDQAWGTFQVAGALHDASAAYYANNCNAPGSSIFGAMDCGHPGDKWGWAASVAATIKLPFIARGDRFAFQVNFAEGAQRYVTNNSGMKHNPSWFGGSRSIGVGWATDAVLRDNVPGGQNGTLELTQSWGFAAAYEHKWTPYLKTSWYGGAYQVDYNANATQYLCSVFTLTNTPGGPEDKSLCDPNFGVWYVGSRTQWNIRPDFYMGVDILYENLQTAHEGAFADLIPGGQNARSAGFYKFEDQDAMVVTFRVQRSFVP